MIRRTPAMRACLALSAACLLACGDADGGRASPRSPDAAHPDAAHPDAAAPASPAEPGGARALPSGAGSHVPAPGDSAALAASADAPCAMFGLWEPCSVIRRLESAGLGPTPLQGAVSQPGISIEGSAIRLGRGELQVYLYADSASAIAEAGRLEPRDMEPAKVRGIRPRPPAVIRSANLVALLFNNNDRQVERVQLALTAGLPAA